MRTGRVLIEFANLYRELTSGDIAFPEKPEDIRAPYDGLAAGTLKPGDAPDGGLFRAYGVGIKAPTDRVVHRFLPALYLSDLLSLPTITEDTLKPRRAASSWCT